MDAVSRLKAEFEPLGEAARAETLARVAVLCAALALLAAPGSLGLSVQTLQSVHALRLTVQSMAPPPAASR